MTNRILWLLISYLGGLSLALTLGNRQTTTTTLGIGAGAGAEGATNSRDEERAAALAAAAMSNSFKAAEAMQAAATVGRTTDYDPVTTNSRHIAARNALHDWLAYDKRTGADAGGMLSADRLLLLDDVLSAVLGNYYRQQQQQQQQRHHQDLTSTQQQHQRQSNRGERLNFLYDEDDEDDEDESEDETLSTDEDDETTINEPTYNAMLRSGRPHDSAIYADVISPLQQNSRPRSIAFIVGLCPASFGFPYVVVEPTISDDKPPGKRNYNQISGYTRQEVQKESHQQKQQPHGQLPAAQAIAAAGANLGSQLMHRSARGNRQYDVPQIECPVSEEGMERFACPTADRQGRYRCIDDHVLCDGFIDCPTGEDEDRQACMFYKTTKAHLDVLADALLRWARGR